MKISILLSLFLALAIAQAPGAAAPTPNKVKPGAAPVAAAATAPAAKPAPAQAPAPAAKPAPAPAAAPEPALTSEADALAALTGTVEQKVRAIQALSLFGTAKSVPVLAGLLPDKELHDYARNALEIIPDPSAGQALVAALDKLQGDLLTGVVISLGDRQEKAAVPALKKLASNPKSPAADAAISSLALIATDEAAGCITALLKSGSAETKLAAAHAALRAASRMPQTSPARQALLNAAHSAKVPAHLKAAAVTRKESKAAAASPQAQAHEKKTNAPMAAACSACQPAPAPAPRSCDSSATASGDRQGGHHPKATVRPVRLRETDRALHRNARSSRGAGHRPGERKSATDADFLRPHWVL